VDPRAGLDDVDKRKFLTLAGLELRPFGRPARSQSLYRLRYHGSLIKFHSFINSSMALQPFVGTWPLLQFRNLFYTDGRTPWTSDQPVARPLPSHRTTQTENKRRDTSMPRV
jgi:hypothetical protein